MTIISAPELKSLTLLQNIPVLRVLEAIASDSAMARKQLLPFNG
jgi:hypothetical protein